MREAGEITTTRERSDKRVVVITNIVLSERRL
jgi:hypothetical protein